MDADLPCVQCGYNLRTQLPDGDCPECGRLIDDTLRLAQLFTRDPRWLSRMARSMSWTIVSLSCLALATGVGTGYMIALLFNRSMISLMWSAPILITGLIIALVAFWGLTSPDSLVVHRERRLSTRRIARAGLLGGIGILFTNMVSAQVTSTSLTNLLGILFYAALTVGSIALLWYGASIARLVPNTGIARQAKCVGAGYGLVFATLATVFLLEQVLPQLAMPAFWNPFVLFALLYAVMTICSVWSIGLLIWFRRRFREAARLAAQRSP